MVLSVMPSNSELLIPSLVSCYFESIQQISSSRIHVYFTGRSKKCVQFFQKYIKNDIHIQKTERKNSYVNMQCLLPNTPSVSLRSNKHAELIHFPLKTFPKHFFLVILQSLYIFIPSYFFLIPLAACAVIFPDRWAKPERRLSCLAIL